MCSSVDYWRCRWIKLGGALEYPQRGPSDPHPGPDLSTACPQGYPQGWREDPQGVENGARRCGDAHISLDGGAVAAAPGQLGGPHPGPRAGGRGRLLLFGCGSPRRSHDTARPGPCRRRGRGGRAARYGTRSLPGRAVRSKPWGSIRDGREPQGRRPASAPSGRPSRPGCSMVDIVGVLSRTRIGSELEGLPAQRGRGQAEAAPAHETRARPGSTRARTSRWTPLHARPSPHPSRSPRPSRRGHGRSGGGAIRRLKKVAGAYLSPPVPRSSHPEMAQ